MIKNRNLDFKSGGIGKVFKKGEVTMERRWITVNECAELLSLHPLSVRKMIARGKIPAVRIGRTIRIDLRALEADLERQLEGKENKSDHK